VDVDTVEHDLASSFRTFVARAGDPAHFTASSDAGSASPSTLLNQVRSCVLEHNIGLHEILPCVTSNTAHVLKLEHKGRLQPGADADVIVLDRKSLELREAIAGGRRLFRDGALAFSEAFLRDSERKLNLHGDKA
jgi:predicted amidohydrolase